MNYIRKNYFNTLRYDSALFEFFAALLIIHSFKITRYKSLGNLATDIASQVIDVSRDYKQSTLMKLLEIKTVNL